MTFKTGQIVMTRGIATRVEKDGAFSRFIFDAVAKYMTCDWGELCKEDKAMNDSAVKNSDDRIVARYNYGNEAIYIITEYDRSATTILFIDEY